MKVPPPTGPPPGPAKPDAVKPNDGLKETEKGAKFAEKLSATGAAKQPAGAQAAQGPMAAHLEAVSKEMAAGKIRTKEEAVSRLVDRLLDSKFSGKLPPESLSQMKAAVAAEVVSDPHLSERLDRLLGQSA